MEGRLGVFDPLSLFFFNEIVKLVRTNEMTKITSLPCKTSAEGNLSHAILKCSQSDKCYPEVLSAEGPEVLPEHYRRRIRGAIFSILSGRWLDLLFHRQNRPNESKTRKTEGG